MKTCVIGGREFGYTISMADGGDMKRNVKFYTDSGQIVTVKTFAIGWYTSDKNILDIAIGLLDRVDLMMMGFIPKMAVEMEK